MRAPDGVFDIRFGEVAFKGPQGWDCRSSGREGVARLVANKASLICKLQQPLVKGTLYTQQFDLELSYVYRSLVQESLRIKESSR